MEKIPALTRSNLYRCLKRARKEILFNFTACFSVLLKKLNALDGSPFGARKQSVLNCETDLTPFLKKKSQERKGARKGPFPMGLSFVRQKASIRSAYIANFKDYGIGFIHIDITEIGIETSKCY